MKRRSSRSIAVTLAAAATMMTAVASATSGEVGDVTAVRLSLDGSPVAVARSYSITGHTDAGNRKVSVVELERGLTSDPTLVAAFGSGERFASATIEVLDGEGAVIIAYGLSDVSIRSFTHDGASGLETVALRGESLTLGS